MAKVVCLCESIRNESGCDYILEHLGKGFSKFEVEDDVGDSRSSDMRENFFLFFGKPGKSRKRSMKASK